MTYNKEIDERIKNCEDLEKIIKDFIMKYNNASEEQKNDFQIEIDNKIKSLKIDLDFIDNRISLMNDIKIKDEYISKYNIHKQTVQQLENDLKAVNQQIKKDFPTEIFKEIKNYQQLNYIKTSEEKLTSIYNNFTTHSNFPELMQKIFSKHVKKVNFLLSNGKLKKKTFQKALKIQRVIIFFI